MWKAYQRLRDALRRGHHFIKIGIWTIGRPGEDIPSGFIVKQFRVAILLFRGLIEETLLLRASALTFATLLFIIPFLVFVFSFIQTFDLGDRIYAQLSIRVNAYLSQTVALLRADPQAGEAAEEPGEPPLPEAASNTVTLGAARWDTDLPMAEDEGNEHLWRDLVKTVFPAFQPEGDNGDSEYTDPVQLIVGMVEKRATSMQTLGLSGALYILVTVLGLMRNVEWSFNRIWGVPASRSLMRTLSDYVIITLLLPFVAAGVLGITAALQSNAVVEGLGWLTTLLRGGQLAVVCLTFSLVYYYVPNTRVHFRCALIGGVVAGLLWAAVSWYYIQFNYGLARYTFFFSTFALFPMLLFWIYLSWIILLFGCLVSFAYQHEKTFALARLADRASHAYREALAVRVVTEAARRFAQGAPAITLEEAVEQWNVPTLLINEVLDTLVRAGLMDVRSSDPGGARDPNHQDQVMYKPARDPRRILVLDIVRALRDHGEDPSLLRQDTSYGAIYHGMDEADPAYMRASVADLMERLEAQAQPVQP
jgi:membrane protein